MQSHKSTERGPSPFANLRNSYSWNKMASLLQQSLSHDVTNSNFLRMPIVAT